MERFRVDCGDRIALAVKERNVVIERLKRIEDNVSLIQKKSQKAKGHEVAVAADLRAETSG